MFVLRAPCTCKAKTEKKVIQDFLFSDLRAGGTKRVGDVTVENFEKKFTELFTISVLYLPIRYSTIVPMLTRYLCLEMITEEDSMWPTP